MDENLVKFMVAQVNEAEKHKWIESEKAGYDKGNDACIQWVKLHAAEFRKHWEKLYGI